MSVAVALDFCESLYSADTGRLLQMDPDPGKVKLPSTLANKYTYALNNPTNKIVTG